MNTNNDTTAVTFDILGLPAPQGDKSAVMVGGKARLIEGRRGSGRERHRDWRSAVAEAARTAAETHGQLDGALRLSVTFRFPMPASRPKRVQELGEAPKISAPDLDKLLRALGDGLTAGGLIRDDARIASLGEVDKVEVIGWTGAVVQIEVMS